MTAMTEINEKLFKTLTDGEQPQGNQYSIEGMTITERTENGTTRYYIE